MSANLKELLKFLLYFSSINCIVEKILILYLKALDPLESGEIFGVASSQGWPDPLD